MSLIGRWPLSLKTDSLVAGTVEAVKSVPITVYLGFWAWTIIEEEGVGHVKPVLWLYIGCALLTLLTALCVMAATATDNHRFLLPYIILKVGECVHGVHAVNAGI